MDILKSRKAKAYKFFSELESTLNSVLPGPKHMSRSIGEICSSAKDDEGARHQRFPEAAFLAAYAVPEIHNYLINSAGLTSREATKALLFESYRSMPEYCSHSPARSERHPFRKTIGAKARDIVEQWKGNVAGNPVVQSCPDLALRSPCPFKVVIEGKYFPKGGIVAAETSLATDIYQAFFYLGLSNISETKTHPAWDYDYSLLLAYDATPDGTLKTAWDSLDREVKKGCWEGANIYVMILRGS
jgi:hypothetical protein